MNKRGLELLFIIFFAVAVLIILVFWFYFRGDGGTKPEIIIMENNENAEINDSSSQEINETHLACLNNSCVVVQGDGADGCSNDTDCQPVLALPDLIVKNISMEVTSSIKNTTTNITFHTVTVFVKVENIGSAKANQSVTRISFGGDELSTSSANLFTPSLELGKETIVELSYEDLNAGDYDATAFVDDLMKIDELNEKNNGFSVAHLIVKD